MLDSTSSLEMFQYESVNIRTVDVPNRGRWAVAADICLALEIQDVRRAVSRLDEADRLSTPVRSGGQNRNMWVVSENGATDLVLDSRKPEARAFRRFLTHEVWPSIRDTGSYATAPALAGPELMATALLEAASTLKAKDARSWSRRQTT
ncbi:Bro-N domain-containing protein [Rhodococcus jostii]|uniref:BRO-N domain-containing protein n=1 Tax=Rhodococcus jostii TaxID=132919 RepID=UPI003637334E